MSKSKRVKSGSAHDNNKWENALTQLLLNDESWRTCVFFLMPNKQEDNAWLNISCEVIATGLRKLFNVITKESLYREVKEFCKASGGGKGKGNVKLPEFVEICEVVKPFIEHNDEIPAVHLAKLLKFKLLHLKTMALEKLEEVKKKTTKGSASGKESKRGISPGKGSKSPKRKGKKGENETQSAPKKDTKMKKRGEVEDLFQTIDDEPDSVGSPQQYILIHGFNNAVLLQYLANIHVHVNAIINVQQNQYKTVVSNNIEEQSTQESIVDDAAEAEQDENGILCEKQEKELVAFWKESEELIIKAPNGHRLKDIAKYDVKISMSENEQGLEDIEADKKTEIGTEIFDKIANICYDMLDHERNYQEYLSAMKLLHIPIHSPYTKEETTTDVPSITAIDSFSNKDDLRYYNHLASSVPVESTSVAIILHCLVEQVVANVNNINPLDNASVQGREDDLDHDIAEHFELKISGLALTNQEKKDLIKSNVERKQCELGPFPQILGFHDKVSQRLSFLKDVTVLDSLKSELAMLAINKPCLMEKFPARTLSEMMESKMRFCQFVQHCSLEKPDDITRLLKNYTFEGIPLQSVDKNGNIVEPHEKDEAFSTYNNPWDDPYCDLTKYFNARNEAQKLNNGRLDSTCLSASVDLVSFRKLDEWCYMEELDGKTITQVFEEARITNPCVDTYYHHQDDTLLVVFHNPTDEQLYNRKTWNVKLHSNVGFRNFLDHVSTRISEWTKQRALMEEDAANVVSTPVTPDSRTEPAQPQAKTGSRYGLKTRAEIAALKAEEEDKGKKKGGKKSSRARSRSGKKSQSSKRGSAETKTSSRKSGTTSANRTSKNKLNVADDEPISVEIDDEAKEENEVFEFLGYDVADDLIHVTGVQTSMFPYNAGEIRVDKTTFVNQPSSVTISVLKDGDMLKLHFLEPLEELVEDDATKGSRIMQDVIAGDKSSETISAADLHGNDNCNAVSSGQTAGCCHDYNDDGDGDGIEKSEYEDNEKEQDKKRDVQSFCKHGSFVAQLNDGMIITCSGFGGDGVPPPPPLVSSSQHSSTPLINDYTSTSTTALAQTTDAANQATTITARAPSAKLRKKNGEETKKVDDDDKRRSLQEQEEQTRKAKEELDKLNSKEPFNQVHFTSPDGLHVTYCDNYPTTMNCQRGVVVRQRYPVSSHGLHDCEIIQSKIVSQEKSRTILTDGTVIKLMVDDSVEVLYPNGMTSKCSAFFPCQTDIIERSDGDNNNNGDIDDEGKVSDQGTTGRQLQGEWTVVSCDGECFMQNMNGTKRILEPVKMSRATCPVTGQIYKTREDNVVMVLTSDGTQIIEHSDGTRMTTFYQQVSRNFDVDGVMDDKSMLVRHVKVEREGFATVVMNTEKGTAKTLFGNGNQVHTISNGDCVLIKSDGVQIHFDVKGNIVYVPRDSTLGVHHRPEVNLATLNENCEKHSGVYRLRTTSQHCCEIQDERGDFFSAFTNGQIKIIKDEENEYSSTELDNQILVGREIPKDALGYNVPRFFILNRDGSGFELLRGRDVCDYIQSADDDAASAVLRIPSEEQSNLIGITVLRPFQGGIGKIWSIEKDEKNLIPEGLRERDFKSFPANDVKKIGETFGKTAGSSLSIGNMRQEKMMNLQPWMAHTCPKVLELRHFLQYQPLNDGQRVKITTAFQKYGDYVLERQLQADNLLPREPRSDMEIEKNMNIIHKHEQLKPKILDKLSILTDEYIKSMTAPTEEVSDVAAVWKRRPGEWERDRIELAKLEYGKHALRHKEVPPYFETSQGQTFLTQLKNVADMKKLTGDLDKEACPDTSMFSVTDLSTSSDSMENNINNHTNTSKCDDSSAIFENSSDEQPIQTSTPFCHRPVNPTPAQAAAAATAAAIEAAAGTTTDGVTPTTTSLRPTNPTPAKASTIPVKYEVETPIASHVNGDCSSYTSHMEVLEERRNEVSFENGSNDRINLASNFSATDSQFNDDIRVKSLFNDVTGSPRTKNVTLPKSILGTKPAALPNTQYSAVELPTRRKIKTVSVAGNRDTSISGFQVYPAQVDFGILKEGCTYVHGVMMKNVGIDLARFKIRQPPPSTGMKVLFTPGPVAAGMTTQIDIEIFAVAVGVSGETGIGSVNHHIEIVGESHIIYLPVSAIILTGYDYDNRSHNMPRGRQSDGTKMISNRPPSRHSIRARRDHLYSNVAKNMQKN